MNRSSISLSDNWIAVPDKEFSMSEDHIQVCIGTVGILCGGVRLAGHHRGWGGLLRLPISLTGLSSKVTLTLPLRSSLKLLV